MESLAMEHSSVGVSAQPCQSADLAVIIPTFNESSNIAELVRRIRASLQGIRFELIFVDDDSPDRTWQTVRELARTDPRIRCIRRVGRRGLSSAVIEGMLATGAPFVGVMDADLQHDETLLSAMFGTLREGDVDLVIGSRYVESGGIGEWDSKRAAMSRFATSLSRFVIKQPIGDPMSGFFMLRREVIDQVVQRLSGQGYKILLDIVASSESPLRVRELPYTFRARFSGESKLDANVLWQYVMMLFDKRFGHIIPARFLMFALVGLSGVAVHLGMLSALMAASMRFAVAQGTATVVAMTTNFLLNNVLTYRDKRLHGWRFVKGLVSFYLVCGLGAVANVGVASSLYEQHYAWVLAGVAGILVGVIWNYLASAVFTWKKA